MIAIRILRENSIPSTPTALRPPAQGCEERASLGKRVHDLFQPQRGCGMDSRVTEGRNPVGVDVDIASLPRVARSSQPWALRRNPVGILRLGRATNGGAK